MTSDTGQYEFKEPRNRPDFRPEHYPTANGKPALPFHDQQRKERIKAEFLAVYYDLNGLYERLLEARKTEDLTERKAVERRVLQAVEKALISRDALEDRYAPMGVIADPVVEHGFTKDVRFSFGDVDGAGQRRSEVYTVSTYVPVPLPDNLRFEELPMKITGPGFFTDGSESDG